MQYWFVYGWVLIVIGMVPFVANAQGQPNRVYLNDGNGIFTDSGQTLGNANGNDVILGDVDKDGFGDLAIGLAPTIMCFRGGDRSVRLCSSPLAVGSLPRPPRAPAQAAACGSHPRTVHHTRDGDPLPPEQGGPVRMLIPGDAGPGGPCANVKGVVRIALRPAEGA